MVHRLIKPLASNSFFLFGARGTGKTYFLRQHLDPARTLTIDLLDPEEERRLVLSPKLLKSRVERAPQGTQWVFIDEVQKVPALLDLVHQLIESQRGPHEHNAAPVRFALTGSSARKLKRGSANLLAGRAFTYHLFPLCAQELGEAFRLDDALRWGTLPKLLELPTEDEKAAYLRSYTTTYLKEEVAVEQLVRRLDPFQRFLPIAAQMSGEILNFTKIARDIGASVKTAQSYFEILEDTLLGTFLPPFHESIRKRQAASPKFYLFDTGVRRALQRLLNVPLAEQSYEYGQAFEHFIVNEVHRLQSYKQLDYELSFLRTHDQAEIDLVIERPGMPRALVEIKSTPRIEAGDLRSLIRLGNDIANSELFCLSRDPHPQLIQGVACLPWRQGLVELGL